MNFTQQDIEQFKNLVSKGSTPEQAKEIILGANNEDTGNTGFTKGFLDISANIYKGVENLGADVINLPLRAFGKPTIKPISEQLFPTGEEYKGGILNRSVDTIGKRGQELGEVMELGGEEQTRAESVFQGTGKLARGVLDIGGDAFISTLSTLTPDKQKEQLTSSLQEIAQKKGVESAIAVANNLFLEYQQFKAKNPRAGRNTDAFGTLIEGAAEIVTGFVGVRGGKKVFEEGSKLGRDGIYKAEDIIKKQFEQGGQKQGSAQEGESRTIFQQGMDEKRIAKIRETEEIAGNILQPYKGMTENLGDANLGLQRVLKESNILESDDIRFSDLLTETKQLQDKYGRMLDSELSTIKFEYKDESIFTALGQLEEIYKGVGSKEMRLQLSEITGLLSKAETRGLNPSEINQVKILHTKANSLFNAKGQETGGFASDDLRNVRRELKVLVENLAEENGVKNIKEVNKTYGQLASTNNLLKNQVANLKAYQGRQLPETVGGRIGSVLGKVPLISGGLRGLVSELGFSLRSDKINPIQVQKKLKDLASELNKAGVEKGEIDDIIQEISNEVKLLPETSSFKKEILTDNQIIQDSKIELNNAKIDSISTRLDDIEEVIKENEQLSLPRGKIITPQTVEKGAILEGRKELLNTKGNLNFRLLNNKLNESDLDLQSLQKSMDFKKIEDLNEKQLIEYLNSQDRQKSILRQEYEESFERDIGWDEYREMKIVELLDDDEKIYQVLSELENSEAGKRIFIEGDVGSSYDVIGQSSTFPQWVSSDLRDSELFNKTIAYINNADIIPEKNTRMRALADEIYTKINYKLKGLYEDKLPDLIKEAKK